MIILFNICIICLIIIFIIITSIHKYMILSYDYAILSYKTYKTNRRQMYIQYVLKNKIKNKQFFNICGKECVRKDLITTASNASFNNWNESDTKEQCKGFLLLFQLLRAAFDNRYCVPIVTGGTSGNSMFYWYNYDEGIRFVASTMRCWIPYGWDTTKTLGIFYGHPSGGLSALNNIHSIIPNLHILLPSFSKSGDLINVDAFIRFIEIGKPYVVETMPNLFFRACELCYKKGVTFIHHPKLISMSGDFLFTCQYRFIQSMFPGSILRMAYGSVEFGQIAQQQDENDIYLYKVFSEYAYVENTDDGRLIISRLDYKNMPMLRYETDDYGTVVNIDTNKQILKGLVGKKRYNYIEIDNLINKINLEGKIKIINFRLQQERYEVQFTILNVQYTDTSYILSYLKSFLSDTSLRNYIINIIVCNKQSCISTDKYDTKVLPLLA